MVHPNKGRDSLPCHIQPGLVGLCSMSSFMAPGSSFLGQPLKHCQSPGRGKRHTDSHELALKASTQKICASLVFTFCWLNGVIWPSPLSIRVSFRRDGKYCERGRYTLPSLAPQYCLQTLLFLLHTRISFKNSACHGHTLRITCRPSFLLAHHSRPLYQILWSVPELLNLSLFSVSQKLHSSKPPSSLA